MESALTAGILTSIPGRYAKALFDLAQEQKQVGGIGSSLKSLVKLLESSKDLKRALMNPTISEVDHMAILTKVCSKLNAPSLFLSFIKLTVKAHRLPYLTNILEIYNDLVLQEQGEQKVEVISAYPLTGPQVTLLKDKLKKVFPRSLNLTFTNDTSLLGGVMVRVGCRIIDASLVTQLNQLVTVMKGKA